MPNLPGKKTHYKKIFLQCVDSKYKNSTFPLILMLQIFVLNQDITLCTFNPSALSITDEEGASYLELFSIKKKLGVHKSAQLALLIYIRIWQRGAPALSWPRGSRREKERKILTHSLFFIASLHHRLCERRRVISPIQSWKWKVFSSLRTAPGWVNKIWYNLRTVPLLGTVSDEEK